MKKIIVTGANGQLGSEFRVLEKQYGHFAFYFFDRQTVDITNERKLEEQVKEIQPDFIINCAAYTAVDKAESDQETAFLINRDAVENLAKVSAAVGAKFLHISTDYVFDGTPTMPLQEDHPTNPVNTYGNSKLEGEQRATRVNGDTLIIRTSWVYSAFGNNFVKTMVRLMASRPQIGVVADQWGSPTYAADLAATIMQIIQSPTWVPGIYHYSNEGIINWYDFAVEIKQQLGASCEVHAITTDQYPTPAKRPAYSVMDKTKIQETFGIRLKYWKESLKVCIEALKQQAT